MTKRWLFATLSLLLLATATIGVVFQVAQHALVQGAQVNQPRLMRVDNGMSLYALMEKLDSSGIYRNSHGLKLAFRMHQGLAQIKAGTYEITPSQQLIDFLEDLNAGKEKQFSVTLVEGLTLKQWLAQLNDSDYLEGIDGDQPLQQWIGQRNIQGGSLEGWLLPNTYAYTAGSSALQIVDRAHQAMQRLLAELWQAKAFDLPYKNAYEALIMASIIEKETGVAHERSHIAGVFVNRLHRNMRLQTDPTVIYGIGPTFDGNITRKHLRTPTPYNTYVIKGLPPTPIAMAGKAAIHAALQPKPTDALYFVAKGDGSHQFSTTLEAHNAAVRKYQLKR